MRKGGRVGTLLRVVLDTSVFIDYFVKVRGFEEMHKRAREVMARLSELQCKVYEPFIFEIELSAVLARCGFDQDKVRNIVQRVLEYVSTLREEELHDLALKIALSTGCRAVDAYYIATAIRESAILVTCDRVMYRNARKLGTETYNIRVHEDYVNLMTKLTSVDH